MKAILTDGIDFKCIEGAESNNENKIGFRPKSAKFVVMNRNIFPLDPMEDKSCNHLHRPHLPEIEFGIKFQFSRVPALYIFLKTSDFSYMEYRGGTNSFFPKENVLNFWTRLVRARGLNDSKIVKCLEYQNYYMLKRKKLQIDIFCLILTPIRVIKSL